MASDAAHAFPKPAVSVVIPLYNKASHIQRAVRSVLDQTFSDFELVVVDDGSTDGGSETVSAITDPRIRVVRQANAGVSAARNRGIDEARSELIAFLDADDEWRPHFLETISRLARQFPQCGAFGTGWEMVEVSGRRSAARYAGLPDSPWEGIIPDYFRCLLGPSPPLWSSAIAVPQKTFRETGLFSVGERIAEDLEMWFRIALRFPIAFSTRIEAVYRHDTENRASFSRGPDKELKIISTIENAINDGAFPPGVNVRDLAEYRNRMIISYAAMCVRCGRKAAARRHLRRASSTRAFIWSWSLWYLLSCIPNSSYIMVRNLRRFFRGHF